MNDLVKRSNSGLPSIQELKEITSICQTLATSKHYQNLGAGGVLSIWLTALEMGIPVMQALNGGLHSVDGKITMSGNLIAGLIVKAGHRYEIIEHTDEICTIQFFRKDAKETDRPCIHSWGKKEAELAGYFGKFDEKGNITKKPKENYISFSKSMYFNRCMSSGCKLFLPEIGLFYSHGELDKISYEDVSKPQESLKIDHITSNKESYDDFCRKYAIFDEGLGKEYVFQIIENMTNKKSFEETIHICMKKEQDFSVGFERWKQAKEKKESNALIES